MKPVYYAIGFTLLGSACSGQTDAEKAAEILVRDRFIEPSSVRIEAWEGSDVLNPICGEVTTSTVSVGFVVYREKATFESDDLGYGHVKYKSLCDRTTFNADHMDVLAHYLRDDYLAMKPLLKDGGDTIEIPVSATAGGAGESD